MDINKKNRTDIKAFFVKNAIPTENNFADLIEAGINQKEDGIAKLAGNPLSIEAEGGLNSTQKLLNFYTSFADDNPSWMISQNPREVPNNAATSRPGFNIADGSGTTRLFISKGGDVGIGTLTPGSALDVKGSISVNGENRVDSGGWFNSYGVNGWRNVKFGGGWFMRDTTWIEALANKNVKTGGIIRADNGIEVGEGGNDFKILSNGNVGIGTPSPTSKLTVTGNGGSVQLYSGKPNGHIWIGMYTAGNTRSAWFGYGSEGTSEFRIRNEKPNGEITLDPIGRKVNIIGDLNVLDTGDGVTLSARDKPIITRGFDVFTSGIYKDVGRWGLFMEPHTLTLGISNMPGKSIRMRAFNLNSTATELLHIGQNGRIGIGTTAPEANLHIKAGANQDARIIIEADPANRNEAAQPSITMYQDGKKVIGHIGYRASTNDFWLWNRVDHGRGLENAGYIVLKDGNSIQVSKLPLVASDVTLKTNIKPLGYGLKEILSLKPVTYQFKNDPKGPDSIGLIAQDVQKVISEIVQSGPINETENKLHLAYSELIPVLINAVKELNQKIDNLTGLSAKPK